MAYETFTGRDASGSNVSWVGDSIPGIGFALVVKLDAGADGAQTGPVSSGNPLPVREPVRGIAIGKNSTAITPGTGSTTVAAANTSRQVIEISNGSASGIWLAFGASAVVNTGTYLPAKATGYWYTTASINCCLETGGTGEAKVGYTEW